jgi:hypothetical protein
MFSANENIALRKHKRRITEYVESTLSEDVLDAGTSVMAMQVSCKSPGCVPLETVICVIFPRQPGAGRAKDGKIMDDKNDATVTRLLPTLPESSGGTYKTTILKPMTDITKDDVLDALPPAFEGGRWSFEQQCLVARDVVLNQISKTVPGDDVEGRQLMTEYVMESLRQFMQNKCVAPEPGQPFPEPPPSAEQDSNISGSKEASADAKGTPADSASGLNSATSIQTGTKSAVLEDNKDDATKLHADVAKSAINIGSGNFVIRRPTSSTTSAASASKNDSNNKLVNNSSTTATKSQSDWRQQQKQTGKLGGAPSSLSSASGSNIIQRLAERERHAPGLRRPGCPCCDPDNPSNVMDQMIGSML